MVTGQKVFSLIKALAASYIITAILLLITAFAMYKLGIGGNDNQSVDYHNSCAGIIYRWVFLPERW